MARPPAPITLPFSHVSPNALAELRCVPARGQGHLVSGRTRPRRLATSQPVKHLLDQRVSLGGGVAGCDELGVHRESIEPAGPDLGDRMPDRTRLRLGHAVRHLEVRKRDRASASAHGPSPAIHLSTAMIVATWTRSPCPALPLRLHNCFLRVP
jgi:hypothetical protein